VSEAKIAGALSSGAGLWRGRAGHLYCDCYVAPPSSVGVAPDGTAALVPMSVGYGLSVLSQVLAISAVPLAAVPLAPSPFWLGAPYAAMLAGGLFATFPAAFLMDIFGRRAAFSLGASLGIAGGAIAAWSIVLGQFPGLVLGCFWLGVAQGFGLYYRHAAAMAAGQNAIGFVLAGGCLAALVAPALAGLVQAKAGPLAPAALVVVAGAACLANLTVAITLPSLPALARERAPVPIDWRQGLPATLLAALAWFAMTAMMGSAPMLMLGCGIGLAGTAVPIAWHVLAMYLPAALAAPYVERCGGLNLALAGAGLILIAAGLLAQASAPAGFTLALILAGCGWSLTMLGATALLHALGTPPRLFLAGHDFCLFVAAMGGALMVGTLRG
jgi:MFS family permease